MEPDRNHADWRTLHPQIARGARTELGDLANTQAKPEVGPFAAK